MVVVVKEMKGNVVANLPEYYNTAMLQSLMMDDIIVVENIPYAVNNRRYDVNSDVLIIRVIRMPDDEC